MTFNHLSHYSIDFKPYNETAMAMFFTSDGDHDGIFTRTELDHVFVVYDTDGLYLISSHHVTLIHYYV